MMKAPYYWSGLRSLAIVSLWLLLVTTPAWARSQGQLTACKSNLKNIGTACEMWATDHQGRYPDRLEVLVPDYLRSIPECPRAGLDTYSQTYRISRGGLFYGVCCGGGFHGNVKLKPNHPSYNSVLGLGERPHVVSLEQCEAEMMALVTFLESKEFLERDPRQNWAWDRSAFRGCPSGSAESSDADEVKYEVEFYPEGFEVLCLGHGHLALGVPPLYPRYNSQKGFLPFEPLPSSSGDFRKLVAQAWPVVIIVSLLCLFGIRSRRASRRDG